MGDYIYVREIDTEGHATTFETPGNMVKIDREDPQITKLYARTEDGILNVKAIVKDDTSGVSKYMVTTTNEMPRDWIDYSSGEISYAVPATGQYYLWIKDAAGNMASGEIYAVKDVEAPKGMIEIEATNILSGDAYSDIIVVAPDIISGEKYTNKDVVTINILVTDNETEQERIMFALYNEEDYAKVKSGEQEIEWNQYVSETQWRLKEEQGENIIYAIFKDVAGNMTLKVVEYQEP